MPRRKVNGYRTAAFDAETDPFKAGRQPRPFAAAFAADDGTFIETWGDDCIDDIMARIAELPDQYLIFVHNGARFDFQFLWDHVEEPVTIIGGKLIEFSQGVTWRGAQHIWRDSFAVLPVALSELGHKREISYAKFERWRREKHKAEIVEYLRADVRELLTACQKFRARFEPDSGRLHLPITLGQLSFRELEKHHRITRATPASDEFMRPWYFGGRNQCYASGIIEGPWRVYDVNSHYGAAMRNYDHPLTDEWEELDKPPRGKRGVWFARVRARNRAAIPWRDPDHPDRIEFGMAEADFWACSHELLPAIDAGLVDVLRWYEIWRPINTGRFDRFVDHWMAEKVAAELAGDRPGRTFAKLVINAASGKLGQDPRKYRQWSLMWDPHDDKAMEAAGYTPESIIRADPSNWLELWSRQLPPFAAAFVNVGTAASITAASRAIMLDGLRAAERVIYCDTDSVVCSAFHGPQHATELGAWKHEATAQFAALAGRKTYCLFDRDSRGRIKPVKWASKGESLTPAEIIKLAKGGVIEKVNAAPVFSLHGKNAFEAKSYRNTVAPEMPPE